MHLVGQIGRFLKPLPLRRFKLFDERLQFALQPGVGCLPIAVDRFVSNRDRLNIALADPALLGRIRGWYVDQIPIAVGLVDRQPCAVGNFADLLCPRHD